MIYSFKAAGDFAPTFVSDNIKGVFGYAPIEYLENPSFWRDRVHADDLARVEDAISTFFQNGVHTVEYRFRRKDGSYCWVNDEQHLIRGSDGKPMEIVGSWSDITARKAAEEEKEAARARLAQLLASSPAVIYSYKAAGDFAPDLRQRQHQGLARLRAAGISREPGFLAPLGASRRSRRSRGRVRPALQERPPHGRVSLSEEGRQPIAG